MSRHVNSISARLSLRSPQRESLEILAQVVELVDFHKDQDVANDLQIIQAAFPTVTDFERDFPSLCFALATGVGKTRLMGAFISYLYLEKGIKHFFVLAPNLTIYNKLIKDFTPNTPKYVFQGIAKFATNPPEIITGDNYEMRESLLFGSDVHINPCCLVAMSTSTFLIFPKSTPKFAAADNPGLNVSLNTLVKATLSIWQTCKTWCC